MCIIFVCEFLTSFFIHTAEQDIQLAKCLYKYELDAVQRFSY